MYICIYVLESLRVIHEINETTRKELTKRNGLKERLETLLKFRRFERNVRMEQAEGMNLTEQTQSQKVNT